MKDRCEDSGQKDVVPNHRTFQPLSTAPVAPQCSEANGGTLRSPAIGTHGRIRPGVLPTKMPLFIEQLTQLTTINSQLASD